MIAKEIAKGKANIEIIKHSTNLGANENFEYVQNKCSTPYFMWLGGHDIIDENYIKIPSNFRNNIKYCNDLS